MQSIDSHLARGLLFYFFIISFRFFPYVKNPSSPEELKRPAMHSIKLASNNPACYLNLQSYHVLGGEIILSDRVELITTCRVYTYDQLIDVSYM